MAFTPNVNDMKILSDAILDNSMQMDELPAGAKQALGDYWAASGVDFSDQDLATSQLDELMKQRQDQESGGGFLDSPFFKPIEWVGSKLYKFYSATVSPILTSGSMALHSVLYGRPDYIGQDGEMDALKDYWDLAHHVSPGQSVWMLGMNDEELKKRGIRPDQIANDLKLQESGKYRDAKTEADPFGVKTAAQEYFSQGAAKYVTGGTDFAVSWYLDPLVLGGKAAGATKRAVFTKNVNSITKGGENMAKVTGGTTFDSMRDTVMKVKSANPDNAALVLRRDMPTLSKSANGDALASLLAQSKDAAEVTDVLRLSIGDHAARLPLEIKNAQLAPQIESLTARNVVHAAYYDALPTKIKASPRGQAIKLAMDKQTKFVNDLNRQNRFIDDKLDAFGSLDNLNYNRYTTPLGMKVRGSGIVQASGKLIHNTPLGWPIKLIRSYGDVRPTHYIDVHGEDSYRALDASLRETNGLSREAREMYVSRYVEAPLQDRQMVLMQMEEQITHRMVDRYNLKRAPSDHITYDLATDLYKDFASRRSAGQAAARDQRSYSGATMPDPKDPTRTVRVAEIDGAGGRSVSTPLFDTQLANSHVLLDFGLFERGLEANGKAFQRFRNTHGADWMNKASGVADTLTTFWKFAQLFRLGYGPRALADDFLGQLARFGGIAMTGRAIQGGKIAAEDFYHGRFARDDVDAARVGLGKSTQKIQELGAQQKSAKQALLRAQAKGGTPADIRILEDDLKLIDDEIVSTQKEHADYTLMSRNGAQTRDVQIGRQVFDAPFGGKQGELFRDLTQGQRNLNAIMGSSSDWYLKKMRRMNWENITPASHGADKHMEAWVRHINDQIGQSTIGREALRGADETQLVKWMQNTAEGQRYRHEIGLKNIGNYELAQRVKAAVDHVLDPSIQGVDDIRRAALAGTLKKDMLLAIPERNRPLINAQQFSYAEGRNPVAQLLDASISSYYNIMNQIPATKLLRNPLFGSSYKSHLIEQVSILRGQGVTHVDEALRKTLEKNARRGALDDVKKFTFTMDHETKMAYHMRHFGAFFGAQQESWNRWGRIISDKPDVLARVAQTYGAPARAGLVVDQDGNAVDGAGYSTDPMTGERKLVKYSQRKTLIQIPEYLGGKALNKALGLDENASFVVPMSSLEIVLNHGDGALPVGVGPYLQIATNHFAKDDVNVADWAKKMGVLPFGAQGSVMDFINPTTGKRLGDSMDDMGETKQRAMFYAMQVENFKYEHGLRKTKPRWEELKDRADRWTIFRTGAAFALPFSVNAQDPYQFFRDEYQRYQKLDQDSADEKFYDKYGDSFYMFSQSMSKNNSGLRATAESVQMSKHYRDLIDKVGPEYAGLIVGAEGDGEYSNGAFYYQKTHESAPGSAETQRSTLGARAAWKQGQVGRGWSMYNSLMEDANSQLFQRGLQTFDDPGAEDLKSYKQGIQLMLTTPELPDGAKNPFYNEDWREAFSSIDKSKYDRTADDLAEIVSDPELEAKSQGEDGTVGIRSDIYTLRGYLAYRKQMKLALSIRKSDGGSDDITAGENYDLKNSWDRTVMALIEADTKFAWVHSRYFATDMGFNINSRYSAEQQEEMAKSDASLIGQQATGIAGGPDMMDTLTDKGASLNGQGI